MLADLGQLDDEALLAARGRGMAGRAFAEFYRRHERGIAAYCLRGTTDPGVVGDLVAETFAQALASRHRFVSQGAGSATRWLYGIARNVRSRATRVERAEWRKSHELGIVRRELTDEQREELTVLATEQGAMQALERLPERQREAIRAYILEDRDYADIAAHDGSDEATIRKRVSRGLARLRNDAGDRP